MFIILHTGWEGKEFRPCFDPLIYRISEGREDGHGRKKVGAPAGESENLDQAGCSGFLANTYGEQVRPGGAAIGADREGVMTYRR